VDHNNNKKDITHTMQIKTLESLIKMAPDDGAPTDGSGGGGDTGLQVDQATSAGDTTQDAPTQSSEEATTASTTEGTTETGQTDNSTGTSDNQEGGSDEGETQDTSWLDKYKDVDEAYRPAEGDEALANLLSTHGLDIAELNKQIITDGYFSEETINTLKAQLPPALVDLQLANMEDALELSNLRNRYATEQIQTRTNDVLDVFGGNEGFNKFNEWASKSLNTQEIDAINRVLADGDMPHEIRMATVQAYAQRMSEDPTVSNAPLMRGGQGNFAPAGGNALTQEEHRGKMSDPKYGVDIEWTNQIDNQRQKGIDLESQQFGSTEYVQPAHLKHRGKR
jgi:hypothetical protein